MTVAFKRGQGLSRGLAFPFGSVPGGQIHLCSLVALLAFVLYPDVTFALWRIVFIVESRNLVPQKWLNRPGQALGSGPLAASALVFACRLCGYPSSALPVGIGPAGLLVRSGAQ